MKNSDAEVAAAWSEMARLGKQVGDKRLNVWADEATIRATADDYLLPLAKELAGGIKRPDRRRTIALSLVWILFATSFVLGVSAQEQGGEFIIIWILLINFVWFFVLLYWLWRRWAARDEFRQELVAVGMTECKRAVRARQAKARQYNPSEKNGGSCGSQAGPIPSPQPYGVSAEGAEELVAQWMRFLGEGDAQTTRYTADGGIDVQSSHYIAQVKNYAGTVGVAEVRQLAGVASVDPRRALFFTSGAYASGAITFANQVGMALLIYDAQAGTLVGANNAGEQIVARGL